MILPVHRNAGGNRYYIELDLRRVDSTKCMRGAGLAVEALIEYVALVQHGHRTIEARKEILTKRATAIGLVPRLPDS